MQLELFSIRLNCPVCGAHESRVVKLTSVDKQYGYWAAITRQFEGDVFKCEVCETFFNESKVVKK